MGANLSQVGAKKRLGQHFLRDTAVVQQTIQLAHLAAGMRVIEIGPGQGTLTSALAKSGADVTAVEFDRDLIPELRKNFSSRSNVRIIESDFLQFKPEAHGIAAPYALIGNIPYNLTSPILGWLEDRKQEVSQAILMMQREVAHRATASPRTHDWGPLAIFMQLAFTVHEAFDIAPTSFEPSPKVWSTVVTFKPRTDAPIVPHPAEFERVVRAGFAQRRKLLANNLSASLAVPQSKAHEILISMGWTTKLRAEELATDGFLTLTERLLADRLIPLQRPKE